MRKKQSNRQLYAAFEKKRFAIPEVNGMKGQDKYTLTWNSIENAKEYLVCVYDGGKKISENGSNRYEL